MIGQTVSHYKITAKLGEGGMGEVYLATDTNLDRPVAIKFLSADRSTDPDARQRFIHEAKAQAMLSHPNIATFHDVGEEKGHAFLVMEYVEGQPLPSLAREEKLSLPEILDLVIQVGEGLQSAHEHGVVHRDIKPENILVTAKRQIKITDFGLAKWKGATTLTKDGTRMGTAYYMSPEQAEGRRVDQRSDIFSLGVILYELVCHQRPFEGENESAILYEVLNTQPQPLARYCREVPDDLQRIVAKCLAKAPEERYQSAADLTTDLRSVKRGSAAGATAPMRRPRPFTTRTVTAAIAGLTAIVLVLLAFPTVRENVSRWYGAGRMPALKHLAVVPFAIVGDAAARQSFSDGLLETLTSRLTQLEQFQDALWVIPASEVREQKISSARQARKAFGVTLAVTGSMQRTEDKVRVTLNLVDAESERQLRSFVIDDYAANVSALQDSVVFELATMLQITLGADERRLLTAGGTTDSEAYDLYLQGYTCIQRYEKLEEIDTALALFQRAVAKDPGYALAVAGLGDAYWQRYTMSNVPQCIEQATQYCQRAIRLDSRLASPHVTLGLIHKGSGRYEEAIREFQAALQLDPLSHRAYRGLASVYEAQNDLVRAEGTYKKAIELKPDYWLGYRELEFFYLSHGRREDALQYLDEVIALNPEGFSYWNDLGAVYHGLGDRDKARRAWERSIEIEPNYAAYSNLGSLYYLTNRYYLATQMYERALALDDHDYQVWMNLAATYRLPGQHTKAQLTFRRAIQMAERQRKINPHDPQLLSHLAECHTALGEHTDALPLIEEALSLAPENVDILIRAGVVYEQLGRRELALAWIGSALMLGLPVAFVESLPELSDLRSDPRCQQLLKRSTNDQGNDKDVSP